MDAASSSESAPESERVADPVVQRIVSSSTDLALVLDGEGVVVQVLLGDAMEEHPGWRQLVGHGWIDTVTDESRGKLKRFLRGAFADERSGPSEINQRVEGLGEIPFRFRGALVDDGHVIALGRDLRPIAEMQQRMVSAQQAMEREHRQLRQADTQYRVLFRVCGEGVLIAKDDDQVVVEANPAASSLLRVPAGALRGKRLSSLVAASSREDLARMIGAAASGTETEVELFLSGQEEEAIVASATVFRQSGSNLVLFRFWREGAPGEASERNARMIHVIEAMPDGFVVTDAEHRILSANTAFCELVQRANETQVTGQKLDRWLGRPGVDLNIIAANLAERGFVREFATIIRGEFDRDQEALVTAIFAHHGEVPCYGFTIRPVLSQITAAPTPGFLPRSEEGLRGLVGRVSLKEIVRESSDMIERLCIEAALDVSSNNRAQAAQLLGLSRQSLYSKLKRYGLDES